MSDFYLITLRFMSTGGNTAGRNVLQRTKTTARILINSI